MKYDKPLTFLYEKFVYLVAVVSLICGGVFLSSVLLSIPTPVEYARDAQQIVSGTWVALLIASYVEEKVIAYDAKRKGRR